MTVPLPPIVKNVLLSAYNPVANFYKNKILKVSHQTHFQDRTVEKWDLIKHELPRTPGSLLDIGCSEGKFTLKAASVGYSAWGIEGKDAAVKRAVEASAKDLEANALFTPGLLTPQAARHLPTYDVILLLSVLHQLVTHYGEEVAVTMVQDLLNSCRQKLILELAGTNRKYGHPVLNRDNDQASVDAFVRRLLPMGWNMRLVGAVPYTDEEHNRFVYVIEREN
ncbi:MAG: hypothetical protein GKS02_11465 [Alphaproteobacteria bacterium]|nr:hypothetical protein [Alphaproteobacteria bacterium]